MQAVFVRVRVVKRVEYSQIMKVAQNAYWCAFSPNYFQKSFLQSDDF